MKRLIEIVLITIGIALVAGCASMGRPSGGPRDIDPPVFLGSNPMPGELNVDKRKIVMQFDENVQIKDLSSIIISPAQQITPSIRALGHRVVVELADTLMPDMTYTLDFADAISDLNEGNVIDGFSLDFSTGDVIDSLQISGIVLSASNLEPARGMLVGVYSDLSDTAVSTKRMERITKTNYDGIFTVRNLKPGTYRIFAINDANSDYMWNRTEDIAFSDMTFTPVAGIEAYSDTLKDSQGKDSIASGMATTFYPNDVLLTWFNEEYTPLYLLKHDRAEARRIDIDFSCAVDTLPRMTLLSADGKLRRPSEEWAILDASATNDSLAYWITDTLVSNMDSMQIELQYLHTDTLDRITWQTDTLWMNVRKTKTVKNKKKEETDTVKGPELIGLSFVGSRSQELNRPLRFSISEPIASWDTTAMRFYVKEDTTWIQIEPPHFVNPTALRPMAFEASYDWEEGQSYRIELDSASIYTVYGRPLKPTRYDFVTKSADDYSSVGFTVSDLDGRPAVIELLNASDRPVARRTVVDGHVDFDYVDPGTYYARLFIDANGNGLYDNGSYTDHRQPEEVYYYPGKIPLKKNWNIADQTWKLGDTPVDMQKPMELRANKPRDYKAPTREEAEDDNPLRDPYGSMQGSQGLNGSNFNTGNNNMAPPPSRRRR